MSALINIYTNTLSDKLIPEILDRLSQYENVLKLDPSFTFNNSRSQFSLLYCWTKPSIEILNNSDLKLSFNTSHQSFDFAEFKKKNFINKMVKQNFISKKLLGKKKIKAFKPIKISADMEEKLKNYNKVFSIKYYAGNLFEHHFATLLAGIITELSGGICHFSQNDTWYTYKNAAGECIASLYSLEELAALSQKAEIAVAS